MSLEPTTDPEAVPLGLLRRYLAAHGWRRDTDGRRPTPSALVENQAITGAFLRARPVGTRNFDIYLLSGEGVEDVELALPREQTATDFLRRIKGAIRTLSDLEGREPEQVITSVRMIGYDVVQSRIPDTMVRDDTINLQVATNYITGLKSLLAATATTEIQPDPFFLRVKKEAAEYADRCRFAHTFRGSFGFSIESPVVPNDQLTLPQIEQPRPFERLVMERFARGVRTVRDAIALDSTAQIVANFKTGFSANACELFADLIEDTSPAGLVISFGFSPEWPSLDELIGVKDVLVGPRHVEVTRAAAKELRQQIQPRAEKIVGRVVRLESDADPSDLMNPMGDREIAVQWSSEDLGEVLVRVALTPVDYLQAHAAHGAGKSVMVSGTLERRGRHWVLNNPGAFSVQ